MWSHKIFPIFTLLLLSFNNIQCDSTGENIFPLYAELERNIFLDFVNVGNDYSHFLSRFGKCNFRIALYDKVYDEIHSILLKLEEQKNPVIVENMILGKNLTHRLHTQKQLNFKHFQCSSIVFHADEILKRFGFDQLKTG